MCKSGICNLSRSRDSSGSKLRERRRPSENNLEDSSLCVMVLPEVVTVLAGSGVLNEGMSSILVVTMDNTHSCCGVCDCDFTDRSRGRSNGLCIQEDMQVTSEAKAETGYSSGCRRKQDSLLSNSTYIFSTTAVRNLRRFSRDRLMDSLIFCVAQSSTASRSLHWGNPSKEGFPVDPPMPRESDSYFKSC